MTALLNGAETTTYNLGNGQGFSVKDVIESVGRVVGREVPVVFGCRRAGDPALLVGDATRAKAELNWRPKLKDLDQIVSTAWKWHQCGFNGLGN